MRSSKSRSRNKSNRQRTLGNIVNRVFDSSGPEGKVRGTPQQIIEKYLTLARDAQLSNDRVAEQSFLQHAEHYTRMLGEAQREMNREHEQRQNQPDGGQQNTNGRNNGGGQNGNDGQGNVAGQTGDATGDRQQNQRNRHGTRKQNDSGDRAQPAPDQPGNDDRDEGSGLVDTPESRQATGPIAPVTATMMPAMPEDGPVAAKAKEAAPSKPRAPRAPRKPKSKTDSLDASKAEPAATQMENGQ